MAIMKYGSTAWRRAWCLVVLFGAALARTTAAHAEFTVTLLETSTRTARPGQAATFSIRIQHKEAEPFDGELRCTVKDYWGQTWAEQTFPLALGLDSLTVLDMPFQPAAQGYYELNLHATAGGQTVLDRPAAWSIAVFDGPPSRPQDSAFGTYTIGNQSMLADLVPRGLYRDIAAGGARWGTIDTWWAQIEPIQGKYNWAAYDRWFQAALAEGITPIPHLFATPSWNSTRPSGAHDPMEHYPPRDWEAWGQFVCDFVTRYRDWLVYLRIWNEPNIGYWRGTPAEYAKLIKIASDAARAVKPEIKIVIEALETRHESALSFLDAVGQTLPADAWDVVGIHNYRLNDLQPPERTQYSTTYPALKAWRDARNPKAQIWDTEFACMATAWGHTWKGVGERHQAQWLVRAHAIGFSQGLDKMIWFPGYSWPLEEPPYYNPAGLLRVDLSPRPAYVAYRVLTDQLAEARHAGSLKLAEGQRGEIFQRPDGTVTLLWAVAPEHAGRVSLQFPAGQKVQGVNIMGGKQELSADRKGVVEMTIDEDARYLLSTAPPTVAGAARRP